MSYIDTPPQLRRWGCLHPGHFWGVHTFDRLAWQYGHARAQAIRAGRDPQTNADLESWRNLGKGA